MHDLWTEDAGPYRSGVCSCRDPPLPHRTRARRRAPAGRRLLAAARRVPRAAARPARPTTSTASSARSRSIRRAIWAGGPFSGRAAATPRSTSSSRCRASRSSRGARASRARGASPNASSTGRSRGWQEMYRDGIARSAPTSSTSTATSRTRARRGPGAQAPALRARVRGVLRRARVRRQPRPRRLARDPFDGDVQPRGYTDEEVIACLTFDVVVIGSGPGGATAADVLTEAGWSVIVLEKGRNHLLALDPPFAARPREQRRDQVRPPAFLGPDPLLEPRTYRHSDADGERICTGEVNNLPSTVGGGGFHADGKLPRFREVDFRLAASSDRSTAPTSSTGRSATTRSSRTTPRPNAPRRRRRPHRQPVRGVARRPVPDATGCRHVLRDAHRAGREAPRLASVPRADRREQRRVRRTARVQQLRVLRVLRLPDRGQGRSGRAAAARAAHRSCEIRTEASPEIVLDGTGKRAAACATSTPTARRAR